MGSKQLSVIEPVDPFEGGELSGPDDSPRPAAVDHLGLVKSVEAIASARGREWQAEAPGRPSEPGQNHAAGCSRACSPAPACRFSEGHLEGIGTSRLRNPAG